MRSLQIPLTLLLVVATSPSCFSTITPDGKGSNGGGGNPVGAATVRGQVLLFRAPGEFDPLSSAVQVVWRDRDGRELGEVSLHTGDDGFFAASSTNRDVAQVSVATYKCEYDPDPRYTLPKFTCCLDPQPCPGGCESPWDTIYTLKVAPGSSAWQDLKVSCTSSQSAAAQ